MKGKKSVTEEKQTKIEKRVVLEGERGVTNAEKTNNILLESTGGLAKDKVDNKGTETRPLAKMPLRPLIYIIIHQTHYEKSDWSRAFSQFTIACELDMINVLSTADITFIMSSSMFAWLLSPLACFPQKQNG